MQGVAGRVGRAQGHGGAEGWRTTGWSEKIPTIGVRGTVLVMVGASRAQPRSQPADRQFYPGQDRGTVTTMFQAASPVLHAPAAPKEVFLTKMILRSPNACECMRVRSYPSSEPTLMSALKTREKTDIRPLRHGGRRTLQYIQRTDTRRIAALPTHAGAHVCASRGVEFVQPFVVARCSSMMKIETILDKYKQPRLRPSNNIAVQGEGMGVLDFGPMRRAR